MPKGGNSGGNRGSGNQTGRGGGKGGTPSSSKSGAGRERNVGRSGQEHGRTEKGQQSQGRPGGRH